MTTMQRRGFTLMEVLIVMGVGAVLAVMAYGILDVTGKGSRRVDYRLMATNDADTALDRLERELDFLAPAGLPDLDYSQEVWSGAEIRFFSTRYLAVGGAIELVAIKMTDVADYRDNQPKGPRLTIAPAEWRKRLDAGIPNDTLHAFHTGQIVTASFNAMPTGRPSGHRPETMAVSMEIVPPIQQREFQPPYVVTLNWRPGMGLEEAR